MISIKEIFPIMKKDYARYTDDMMSFCTKNQVQYYLAINTWLLAVEEYCPWTAEDLSLSIKQKGLYYNIQLCNNLAQSLITNVHCGDGLVPESGTFADSMLSEMVTRGMPTQLTDGEVGREVLPTLLFLLRYLKRFSPISTPKLADASISSFFECERRNKMRQRCELSHFWLSLIRHEINCLIDEEAILREWERYSCHPESFILTPGVTKDSDGSILGKLRAIKASNPEAFRAPFGFPMVSFTESTKSEDRSVKVTAVPKNYKSARIIAPEPTYRQARARLLFRVIDDNSIGFDIHDQSINADLAAIGARTGTYSTVDLSNASDTITKSMVRELFPPKIVSLLMEHTGDYIECNGRTYPMETFSTAGNSLTFIVETIVFTAIARAAEYQARLFLGCSPKTALAYGDDIIIPTYAYATLLDALTSLGFLVNADKSFTSEGPGYREACGEEYFRSIRLTHPYFPRFAIEGLIQDGHVKLSHETRRNSRNDTYFDSTTSCLSLQDALFRVAPKASRWLSTIIVENHPLMTKSSWREEHITDLRSIIDTYGKPQCVPLGKISILPKEFLTSPTVRKLEKYKDHGVSRDTKYTSSVAYSNVSPGSDRVLLDLYKYALFLEYGPSYTKSIDVFVNDTQFSLEEIVGVSSPRLPRGSLGVPRLTWGLTS